MNIMIHIKSKTLLLIHICCVILFFLVLFNMIFVSHLLGLAEAKAETAGIESEIEPLKNKVFLWNILFMVSLLFPFTKFFTGAFTNQSPPNKKIKVSLDLLKLSFTSNFIRKRIEQRTKLSLFDSICLIIVLTMFLGLTIFVIIVSIKLVYSSYTSLLSYGARII